MKHKTLSILLAVLMSMIASVASAYDAYINGIYYNLDSSVGEATVTYYKKSSGSNISAYSGSVIIPETITYNSTTYKVVSIGEWAFAYCENLTSVFIPNSIVSIGDRAFQYCSGLTSITIPESVASISEIAVFARCPGLETIEVSPSNPFYDSRENSNAIINTLTGCLVAGCKNTIIPDGILSIGHGAFSGCKDLKTISIPNSVTMINEYAFGRTGLIHIKIPNSVKLIKSYAFNECPDLVSVSLGSNLISLGEYAFNNCSSLQQIYCYASNPPSTGVSAFDGVTMGNITLYVSQTSLEKYGTITPWSGFGRIITIGIDEEYPILWQNKVSIGGAITELKTDTWYYLFQGRGNGQFAGDYEYCAEGDIPENQGGLMTDCGVGKQVLKKDYNPVLSNVSAETAAPYLVRFVEVEREDGDEEAPKIYNIQFGTGNWLVAPTGTGNWRTMTVGNIYNAGTYNVYNIEDGTAYFALNISDDRGDYQELLDNNGTGQTVDTYGSGQKTDVSGNNVWSIHKVVVSKYHPNIQDGEPYTNDIDAEYNEITYTRNFTHTNWQALYVPFEMQYEDWKDDFEVARINNMNQYDDDEDGTVDRTVMEVFYICSGGTSANTPYLIKAKSTGEKTITLTDATLYAAEDVSHDVSSWNTLFTFTGTYSGVSGATMFGNGYYALGDGTLHQAADATNALSPMRWYMAVTDRNGNPKDIGEVKVMVFGEDETDGLTPIDNGKWIIDNYYDLSGRRVTNPRQGIYVKNGRKVVIK